MTNQSSGSNDNPPNPPRQVRSWWGWGTEDNALSDKECRSYGALLPGLATEPKAVPDLSSVKLSSPRVSVPPALSDLFDDSIVTRAAHTYGKAYRDVVRSLAGDLDNAPDLVAFPNNEAEVSAVLDWADSLGAVVVPYGGGSSVVGGVEYRGDRPAVSLDLGRLDRILEVDETSLAARIQAGVLGPALEDQLRPLGFTLRHFPQSFEFSTLGGWLATRAGGHYATLRTHIDDFVESVRAVTPVGVSESWRLPGSGAGPSPDRLMLGSEGTLGVITEAWMRIQRRPRFKMSSSVVFDDGERAFSAVREIAQSGINPANCRLLDPGEAALSGAGRGAEWVLVLGVESAHHPVEATLAALVEISRDNGAHAHDNAHANAIHAHANVAHTNATHDPANAADLPGPADEVADAWRSAFLRMPYVRDGMARMGAIVETFETATTWDRIEHLYRRVNEQIGQVIISVTGAPGLINCRLTHVYPDGAAPYFTVIAAGRPGAELTMWDEIKAASMDLLHDLGATVTHHHAVGRDHRRGYDRQRPDPFALALTAAKSALDPGGILNPGVLIG